MLGKREGEEVGGGIWREAERWEMVGRMRRHATIRGERGGRMRDEGGCDGGGGGG